MSTELATVAGQDLQARMDYSRAVSPSDILPPAFRNNPANVLIATEVAASLGVTPFHLMQEMGVISGKPNFSAKFMRALVRRAGHKLREQMTPEGVARCVIIRSDDPDYEHVAEWDEKKAKDHGYWGKGHWAKNPALMLSNRALSECVRLACPEVLGGVAYTPDEVEDFAPAKHTVTQTAQAEAPGERLGAKGLKAKLANPEPEPEPGLQVTAEDLAAITDMEELKYLFNQFPEGHPMRDAIKARGDDVLAGINRNTGEVIDAEVVEPTEEQKLQAEYGNRDPWPTNTENSEDAA